MVIIHMVMLAVHILAVNTRPCGVLHEVQLPELMMLCVHSMRGVTVGVQLPELPGNNALHAIASRSSYMIFNCGWHCASFPTTFVSPLSSIVTIFVSNYFGLALYLLPPSFPCASSC